MTRRLIVASLIATLSVIVAACSDDAATETTAPPGDRSSAVGPGISITEALEGPVGEVLLINGFIVAREGGDVLLAEALAESYPPQAGGATLVVEGLDMGSIDGANTAEGVTWTDTQIQLTGTIEAGVLTVLSTTSG